MAPKFKRRKKKTSFRSTEPQKAMLDREPYEIPGTLAWLENKPDYVSPEPTQKTERHVSVAKIRRNRQEVEKIKQYIHNHGWQMIEGGEQHGQWINTGKYPNILFEPGQVKEIETGHSVLFPLSNSADDPLGIAFHFEQQSSLLYKIATNEWYTVEDHTRRGRRAARFNQKSKMKRHQKGNKSHRPKNTRRPMYNKSRSAPESSLTTPTQPSAPAAPSTPAEPPARLSLEISE